MTKKRVAVLISGRGSNMMALIEGAKAKDYPAEIVLVLSNLPDASGRTRAPQAAGKIHSDIERGFIRAEVVSYEDYVQYQTMDALRTAGKLRSEGKDYVMQEGDVVNFRFNV